MKFLLLGYKNNSLSGCLFYIFIFIKFENTQIIIFFSVTLICCLNLIGKNPVFIYSPNDFKMNFKAKIHRHQVSADFRTAELLDRN